MSGAVVSLHRHIDCKLVTISLYCTPKKKIGFYRADEHLYRVLDECTKRRLYVCLQQYRGNTTEIVREIKTESVAS